MKKTLSVLLALTMLLLTACGGNGGNTADEPADNGAAETPVVIDSIYEDITGIPGSKTLVTVDGNEVPAAMYFYWAVSNAQNLIYQLQMYAMYYGMYTEAFKEDGTIDWNYQIAEGFTLADQLEQQTLDTAVYYATIENMAKEMNVTLTEEDLAALAAEEASLAEQYRAQLVEKDPTAESLSAEEIMQKYLQIIGINSDLQNRLGSVYFLYQHLNQMVLTEGSPIYLDDEDCNQYGYFADHILIATFDLETKEPLAEEAQLEKTALARELYARLEESGYSAELFASLADEYSEDTGRETNPNGYIFTPGTMVAEFEEATEALGYGEMSGIVESDYGYHIILRKNIADGLALYPDQKAQFVEEHLSAIIDLNMFDADVVCDDAINGLDYVKFYEDYTAAVSAASSGETAAE